jgi:Tfp pilus assembly protein PilN
MIKINLALKKQAGGGAQAGGFSLAGSLGSLSTDQLSQLPIQKIVGSVIVCVAAYQYMNYSQKQELEVLDGQIRQVKAEANKLEAQIKDMSSLDAMQKQLDYEDTQVRAKLETILRLSTDRSGASKLMRLVSTKMSKEGWIESLRVDASKVDMRGLIADFTDIPDFIRGLSEGDLLTDIELGASEKKKGDKNTELSTFVLSAKKRKMN